ncbi:MAG: glycosyltransferase [Thermoprotei archaeon]
MNSKNKVRILFIFTSANFLINYSHWGTILSAISKYSDILLLIDEDLEAVPDGISTKNIYIVRIPKFLRRHKIFRYITILLMFFTGLRIVLSSSIIVTPSGGPSQLLATLLSKVVGKPLVIYLRTDFTSWERYIPKNASIIRLFHYIHQALILISLRFSDKIIAIYKHLYILARNYGIPREKISLLYLGTDLNNFSYCYKLRKRDRPVIGFVGRFSLENGSHLLIQLARMMPQVDFLIVGDSPNRADIPPNIKFTGYVKNSEVPKFLCEMDLFISLKLEKGIPVAVIEALACGIPVVAINIDDLKKSKAAIVIESSDLNYIMKTIDELLSNNNKRLEMSYKAIEISSKFFDMKMYAYRFSSLISSLTRTRSE